MAAGISKAEQSEQTRRALLDAALELFAEHGYANTSTEEVVRRAAVTRGALSYHFRDKAALFTVVYEKQSVASCSRRAAAQTQTPVAGVCHPTQWVEREQRRA